MSLFDVQISTSLVVLIGSLAVDLLLGEPPEPLHPVVWIGRTIDFLRDQFGRFRRKKLAGALLVTVVVLGSGGFTFPLLHYLAILWEPLAVLIGVYLVKSAISVRSLIGVARTVGKTIELEPEQAREKLIALVGRNRSDLSPGEMRSATIESLFENLVDSVISPLFYFFLGSLVDFRLGTVLAVTYKGVNTVDSMVGYKERDLLDLGFFGARLDDLLNWLPSRVAIWFIALAGLSPSSTLLAFRDWRVPSSANSGWPMAAAAGALKVKLVKRGSYTLGKEYQLPGPEGLDRAISLAERTTALYVLLLIGLLLIL